MSSPLELEPPAELLRERRFSRAAGPNHRNTRHAQMLAHGQPGGLGRLGISGAGATPAGCGQVGVALLRRGPL